MSLRARLVAGFLAVVLGPVLLGGVVVAATVDAAARQREAERLDRGTAAVRTAMAAQCQRLAAAAVAVTVGPTELAPARAQAVVDRGLARAVRLTDPAGQPVFVTAGAPPGPWADCAGGSPSAAAQVPPGWGYEAITARAELRGGQGELLGYAEAVLPVDQRFLAWLGELAGVPVTALPARAMAAPADGHPADGDPAGLDPAGGDPIAAAARDLAGGSARAGDGSLVRRVGPGPDQPLPLVVAVPPTRPDPLLPVVAGVMLALVVALAVAWWLTRTAIRPLGALVAAVNRIVEGDLSARVPVRGRDEVARLGTTVNRMVREMRGYVRALSASRHQLRDHLGLLGDTLSSTHDLGRILQVILQTSVGATSARAGVILLGAIPSAEGPGVLIGQCAVGLAGRGPDGRPLDLHQLRIRVGDGLLGGVAASGQPRRGRLDPVTLLADGEPRCATYIAVPFAVPGRLLGVLALFDRLATADAGSDFDEVDEITLQTFAGQAAVAVENVLLHHEAQRLSITDPLTGLGNFRHLRECLRLEAERAARFGRALGVLALDLDRFKQVNDAHGHRAGDAVLVEFAQRVRSVVREVDLAFRRGGEEFVILLPETDATGCVTAARRLGASIRNRPFVIAPRAEDGENGAEVRVTVSIGIAVFPRNAVTGPEVLDAADEALYAAKAAGRDTYVLARVSPAVPTGRGGVAGVGGASNGSGAPRQSRGG